jgi:hypothetical protein
MLLEGQMCENLQTAENNDFFPASGEHWTENYFSRKTSAVPCPVIAEAWVRSRPSSPEFCGGKFDTGQVLLRALLFTTGGAIPSMVHTRVSLNITLLRRSGRRSVGNFKQKNVPPNIG